MILAILQVELAIDWATSLKDKRRVVSGLKDRLHREHQVSAAEVGNPDQANVAVLGIALVSNDVPYAQSVMSRILEKIGRHHDCYITDHRLEMITPK